MFDGRKWAEVLEVDEVDPPLMTWGVEIMEYMGVEAITEP